MAPPALILFEDRYIQKASDNEWIGFNVFPGENPNPNPNFNFLVKKADVSPIVSRTSVKEESFRMVLPPAMSPPRDTAVPLPALPQTMMNSQKKLSHQESMLSLRKSRYPAKKLYQEEDDFKCNAFCLSLPGFGKQKPVRSPKSEDSIKKKMIKASSFSNSTVSLRASLEKFECGSWASTTALARENGRLYFDLPLEMIKFGGGDVQEPVSSGFFFDKETGGLALRSVLKTSPSGRQQRGSAETSPQRRVRFSTTTSESCPASPRSCITPRLLKARNDFNSFLAAQNV
ncbi:hypothetical protein AALP_AA4G117900 [Arabis alpina]|uniref:Uncharacterized protein n=1 Tax=Arabis alpina TaxID=50452 RepID=A0A087H2N7_ARAAL|nr:hypothetical protein AALP_AA4G117900 [Arabis alpina]